MGFLDSLGGSFGGGLLGGIGSLGGKDPGKKTLSQVLAILNANKDQSRTNYANALQQQRGALSAIDTGYGSAQKSLSRVGNESKRAALERGTQNIAAGDFMESAGDGKLRKLASGKPIVQATEDVNNSAGPGDARLRVEAF